MTISQEQISAVMSELAKRSTGGKSKSDAKRVAARKNLEKARKARKKAAKHKGKS
jgi:hypothetical protein